MPAYWMGNNWSFQFRTVPLKPEFRDHGHLFGTIFGASEFLWAGIREGTYTAKDGLVAGF
jgi:hypothetical protein